MALPKLPSYMDRIRAHLLAERGMDDAKATSTAIATATMFCNSGKSPNLPVHVNAESRAEACQAVAELRALQQKAKAKKTTAETPPPDHAEHAPEHAQEEPTGEHVSEAEWSGDPSRYDDAEWERACVLDRGALIQDAKARYALPVREPDGTLNRNAVHAAAGRIGQVHAPHAAIVKAAAALVRLYALLREEPPEELAKVAAGAALVAGAAAAAQHEQRARPEPGEVEERSAQALALEGRTLRGVIPYGVESRDLGGWTEVMRPGCLAGADTADLVATVDHAGLPLGRFPGTVTLEDRPDGMHWSVQLPESRSDVREAVERGDLRASSWRMVVAAGGDRWDGNRRTVERVAALRDVAVVTTSAYPHEAAWAEIRSRENENTNGPTEEETMEADAPNENEETTITGGGNLTVEDRAMPEEATVEGRSLLACFRRAGWEPGRRAEIGWGEFLGSDEMRALTWTGGVDDASPIRRQAGPLGSDRRYAWPAFPSVAVDPGTTSVVSLRQTARSLAAAADVIRALDATTAKPEAGSTVVVESLTLKQVAAIQKGIPNVYLAQDGIRAILGQDLRLSINGGLDKLALDALATAGFHDPTTDPLLVSIRKAVTILQDAGYSPDTVILTPADAEALDVLQTSGTEKFYVFGAGRFAPGDLFGLNVRVSSGAPEPIVVDSQAFGRMYASPMGLQTFEENAGETNTSLLRLEGHAVFGVERVEAAVRIAAA